MCEQSKLADRKSTGRKICVHGVKEFVCLSVCLSLKICDLNYLWTGEIVTNQSADGV